MALTTYVCVPKRLSTTSTKWTCNADCRSLLLEMDASDGVGGLHTVTPGPIRAASPVQHNVYGTSNTMNVVTHKSGAQHALEACSQLQPQTLVGRMSARKFKYLVPLLGTVANNATHSLPSNCHLALLQSRALEEGSSLKQTFTSWVLMLCALALAALLALNHNRHACFCMFDHRAWLVKALVHCACNDERLQRSHALRPATANSSQQQSITVQTAQCTS
jgi:hypothetical protein